MSIWNRLSGRRYAIVSQKQDEQSQPQWEQQDPIVYAKSLRRKSSVVVNQFFNNAIPVHSDGKPKWTRSEYDLHKLLLGFSS